MKLSLPSRLLREALEDAPSGAYIDKLIEKMNGDAEQTNQALTNNLTFADNMNAAVVRYNLTHGSELKIPNPLKTRPVGVLAIRSASINGGSRYAIDSFDWRFIDSGDPKDKQQLGVTARYDLSHAEPCMTRTASAVQSITHGAINTVNGWNTNEFSRGSVITTDNTTFTVSESGTYSVSALITYETATYTYGYVSISTSGGVIITRDLRAYTSTDRPNINVSGVIRLAAGTTFTVVTLHTNAAVAARNLTTERRITVHRLYNDTTPTNTVTLLVIGG